MSSDPARAAEVFAREHTCSVYSFDFSLNSLLNDIDRFINSPALSAEEFVRWKTEAELGAYVGEALLRLFEGSWRGTFREDNPGPNYYLSWVEFGSYRFFPSHFFAYRFSNATTEGTFAEYIGRVLPKIRARLQAFE